MEINRQSDEPTYLYDYELSLIIHLDIVTSIIPTDKIIREVLGYNMTTERCDRIRLRYYKKMRVGLESTIRALVKKGYKFDVGSFDYRNELDVSYKLEG